MRRIAAPKCRKCTSRATRGRAGPEGGRRPGPRFRVRPYAPCIALDGEAPKVHAHVVVGLSDGAARGGHLLEGRVWPTLEVILVESPRFLRKRHDPETGLALIDPAA